MSIDIWQITEKMTAAEMYDDVKENGLYGNNFFRSDKFAVVKLTNACAEMLASYNEISDDQISYLVELDNGNNEILSMQAEAKEHIEKLLEEIQALEQKKKEDLLTEEEENDLKTKKDDLEILRLNYDDCIKEKTAKLNEGAEERINKSRSKITIAQDYGETTVEKGTPLAETEVKGGFFRKLFGTTGKDKKAIGERAVKTGNELLDKVTQSYQLDTEIVSRFKKSG